MEEGKGAGSFSSRFFSLWGKTAPLSAGGRGRAYAATELRSFRGFQKKSAERSPFFNRRRITGRKKSSMPGRGADFGIRKPGSLEPVPVAMDAILPERVPSGRPAPPGRGGKFLSPAEIRRLREKGQASDFRGESDEKT
ncbi:MAG: hypothetical protein C6W56_08460 [Caldibacillus debilis]|nr:MAG: hypothetical protein C6W56_08460 [Caldibacillus debilis]